MKIKTNARQSWVTEEINYGYKYYSFFISKHRAIQEKSIEKEKKIFFTLIHPSQAYIFISFKILDWKSNSSKYSLSHIDQIFDILLEWAYCVQLLFERAIFCTTIVCWNYWVFLLGFWYKSKVVKRIFHWVVTLHLVRKICGFWYKS